MSIPIPTGPASILKNAYYLLTKTDKYQDKKNEAITNSNVNKANNNYQFIMDGVILERKKLEESAVKYNMDFKEYMKKMYDKGMLPYTGSEATDDDIRIKAETLIKRQEDDIYNTDLTEEQIEDLKKRGVTLTAGDNVQTEYLYETDDGFLGIGGSGKYRRTRDTLDEDELKELAQQTYLELIQSDEYFSNYDNNWLKNNQEFIDQQSAIIRTKHDVTTEEGLKKANEELSGILGNKIQEHANNDEQYKSRMSKYDKVISETYGKQIFYRDLVSQRQEMLKEEIGSIYDWSPDFLTYVYNGAWQLGQGKDKTDWGIESARLNKVNKFSEDLDKYYDEEFSTYNFGNQGVDRGGNVRYEQRFKTKEQALAWSKEEKAKLEKSRAENFLLAEEYQRKIELLGAPEFFDKDLNFEFDVDTYQRVLGTQGFQMLAAIPSFGATTFYQEAGGILSGQTIYHAAALAFPELESEEAMNKYMELSDAEQLKYANEAFDTGLINYNDAVLGGMQNAGYDLVSNFFTLGKAAKGVKFLPKVFTKLATQKAWKDLSKYSMKNVLKGVVDIGAPAALEVVTENAQELTSKYYIDKNTIGTEIQNVFKEYVGSKEMWETTAQSAMVPGTLVGGSKVFQGGIKISNSIISDLQALRDPKHLRSYANKRLKVLDDQLAKGEITQEQYSNEVIELETAVETVNNSKNKYLNGKAKNEVLGLEVENVKLQNKIDKLEKENKQHFKDREGKTQGRKTALELERKELKDKILENELGIIKTRLKESVNETRPFLSWINRQKEGIFKDKKIYSFKTIKAATKWINGRKKYLSGAIKKAKGDQKVKLEKELKELNSKSLDNILGGKKNNGVNLGNQAIIIEENVKANIDKSKFGANLGAANTFHHEALHFITDALSMQELKSLEKSTKPFLTGALKKLTDQKINAYKKFYKEKVANGEITREEADLAIAKEYLTSLSDAMRVVTESNYEQDGVLQRAFSKIAQVIQDTINKTAPDLEFDMSKMSGADAFQFLKEYNNFNGKRKINLKLPKLRNIPKATDVKEEELKKFSLSVEDSKEVNKIWSEKGVEGAMDILDILKPTAKGIRDRYRDRPNFEVMKDILLDEIMTGSRGMLDVIMSYEKYASETSNPAPLSGYLNKSFSTKTGFKRYIEIANRVLGEGDQSIFTTDVTEVKNIGESPTFNDDIVPLVNPSTLKEGLALNEDIINDIKNAVVKTFGIRLPQLGSKEFKKALQDNYRNELFKIIKNFMGTRAAYETFIKTNAELIYNALPQSTLNKRFPQFAVPVLNKDGKQLREKTAQGNPMFNKKPFNQTEFENYFLSKDLGASTRGTRKDALSEALSEELAFDATMEVIQKPEVAKKFNTVNEIQGFVLPENYLAILDKDIDRDRNALFSITVSEMPIELSNEFVANRKDFFNNINELGITKRAIGAALDKSFGKGFFGTYRKGIIDDFYKNLQNYKKAQENYEKSNRNFKTTIEDYINTLDNQMDDYLSVSSFFGLKEGMAGIFRNKENVQHQRQYIGGEFAQYLKDKYGPVKAIQILITAKAAFENGTGRGKRGMIYDNKADFVNMLNNIDPDVTVTSIRGGVSIKIGDQVQELKPTAVNEKVTKNHLDEKINIELEEIKAKEAQEILKDLFIFMASKPEGYTKVNQAMVVAGLLGNMKTPLRAAASYRYISTVLPSKNIKDYRYEHIIPARVVAFYMSESYLNGNKDIDVNTLLKDYSVAIIPKSMDNIIGKFFGSTMNPDYQIGMHPSKRYYNMFTKGEVAYAIKDLRNGEIYGQGYADLFPVIQSAKKDNALLSINIREDQTIQEQMETFKNMKDALDVAQNPNAPVKGISVFDFDDTLAISNSKVGVVMPDGSTRRINATQFALESADLEAAGAIFDFTEFAQVIEGKKGPLFDLATRRQNKFTSKDIFILTARPQEAAYAIHAFLKGIGLNIPINNIVGLADGRPEAKADWVLGKAAKGYNNFYFADDAYKNVAAVQKVLKIIDVKNKVEQAKFSISLEGEINQIIEDESGVASWKTFSKAAAKQMGAARKSKWRFFVPPSAEDFVGLLYDLLSKGAKGERQMAFFDKHLLKPFNKAYRDLNNAKETISNDYRQLKKTYKDVRKKLGKSTGYKNFTYDQAIRVYLWDGFGITIPGISKTDQKKLVAIVKKDQRLTEFATILANITKLKEGYITPEQDWVGGSIAKDLNDVVDRIGRKQFLKKWIENKNQIFTDDVMNKIEAIYGTGYADALKDILYRMENGTNRSQGNSKIVNGFMNWVNNSVGAIMFFNMRSALLQTISTFNFINWSDNNILNAGLAFANQPQYWSDFAMIFNSPTLRQRRRGLQKDVNEAELANTAATSKNKAQAALAYLLKLGFTPTQIADSFAIASGGATFYRNRVNTYLKQGLSKQQAEQKAFEDFLETSEKAQQSSRPDLISPIQAGPLGRLIFAFQNTPMQYTRIIKKAMRDIGNNRGDFKTNMSKILYYGAMQNILFTGLQNAMFGQLFEDDEDEEVAEKYQQKKIRMLNNMVDTILRGSGLAGAIVATSKNTIMKFFEQEAKGWTADHTYTMIELTNLSPPVGSKLRKIYSGIQTYKFNKKIILPMGFDIDNPVWGGIGSVVSGVTNFPLDRMLHLIDSVREATDQNNAAWQRIALLLGWRTWDVGATNEEVDDFKNKDKKPIRSKGNRKKNIRPKN